MSTLRKSRQGVLDKVNVYSLITKGNLMEENDKIVCKGQPMHFKNKLHSNMVELKEYKLLITTETYVVENDVVEVESRHLQLPCKAMTAGCLTGDGTFTYSGKPNLCNLQYIRPVKVKPIMKSYLLDEENQILLNHTGTTKIMNCPFQLIKTHIFRNLSCGSTL